MENNRHSPGMPLSSWAPPFGEVDSRAHHQVQAVLLWRHWDGAVRSGARAGRRLVPEAPRAIGKACDELPPLELLERPAH